MTRNLADRLAIAGIIEVGSFLPNLIDPDPGVAPLPTEVHTMPAPKHGRNWLQKSVLEVVEGLTTGKIALPEGRTATPHIIAKIVAEKDKVEAPSTGAVAAVLHRWKKYGFILTHDKPFAFKDFSARGRKLGLEGVHEEYRAKAKKERAAAKAEAGEDAKPTAKPKAKRASKKTKAETAEVTEDAA